MELKDRISEIPRVGPRYTALLKKLEIFRISDLLYYFPRDYRDLSELKTISQIRIGDINTIKCKIKDLRNTPARFAKIDITKAVLQDDTGAIEAVWFNQKFIKDTLKVGMEVVISGKVDFNKGRLGFKSPNYELIKEKQVHTGRIIPVYSETEGLSSKWLRSIIEPLLYLTSRFKEYFDDDLLKKYDLLKISDALQQIHFPDNFEALEKAKRRLAFDELFFLQLKALRSRLDWQTKNLKEEDLIKIPFDEKRVKDFLNILPFILTNDQKIVTYQILKDLENGVPMLRLLEGDVGSGKTVVAAIAIFITIQASCQSVLMAPTEVLARQHYKTITELLMKFGINVRLLVGSTTDCEKKEIKTGLATGTIDLVIGTHALLQPDVNFKKLGFVVIDEQHRFGVEQRLILKKKGNPHLLNMTATPIPRTLALTIYGDQDLSIIKELPKGRKEIITRVIQPKYRKQAELFLKDHILKGRQAFVICPLVEESDKLEVKSVLKEYERLKEEVFPEFEIAVLHGRLKSKEKDQIMTDFKEGKINILVSTSVIEVGVDVPNSTVMVIEGAERFGLAQLHQFRGRVGRSSYQSYCLLFTDSLSETNRKRMKAMTEYNSGFKLSEIDLEIRGAGEVFGVRQSGIPNFKMASLNDRKLINETRLEVENLLEEDPEFKNHPRLKAKMDEFLEKLYAG